ncbi:MAG: dTMP kinase [Polyangiales bacterium]
MTTAPERGTFVVLEGVDGAGKSTQCRRLAEALRAQGRAVRQLAQPSKGDIGRLLRRLMGPEAAPAPGPRPMAALFAADRLDQLERRILPALAAGETVICDRYDHSSVAFQSTAGDASEDEIAWIRSLNRHACRPDVVFVLNVPTAQARAWRQGRPGQPELYEDDALQAALVQVYAKLERHFPEDRIVHIDGAQTEAAVTAALLAALQPCAT